MEQSIEAKTLGFIMTLFFSKITFSRQSTAYYAANALKLKARSHSA